MRKKISFIEYVFVSSSAQKSAILFAMLGTKILCSADIECSCILCQESVHIKLSSGERFDIRRDVFQGPSLSGGEQNGQPLLNSFRKRRLGEMLDERRLWLRVVDNTEA